MGLEKIHFVASPVALAQEAMARLVRRHGQAPLGEAEVIVVLGGMGSMTGSFVGAVSISVLPEVLRGVGEWRMVLYSLVLILFMLFKPGGIFGTNELSDIFRLPWLKRGRDAEASDA